MNPYAAIPIIRPIVGVYAPRGRRCIRRLISAIDYSFLKDGRVAPSRPSRISWSDALEEAAERFAATIRRHGPDSVAFYISGQLMTEDYYVFNKLAKGLIGTNNVDTNSRLCMSSAVAGYKQTLGADAPPCSYDDIRHAKVIFIAGANPAVAHPIIFRYIEDARAANPDLKIIVADPRRSESAEIADLHLPLKPGSDIALFNGLLHVMIEEDILGKTGQYQFVITEIGGTVGDIESLPYIEAVRQLKWEMGNDCTVIHLTLLPYLSTSGELKTKPTQHSVKLLLEYGVQPDVLVCRAEHAINNDIRRKIALFCNVDVNAVIEALDASTIYEVPVLMEEEELDVVVLKKLGVCVDGAPQLKTWKEFLYKLHNPTQDVEIGLIGKYVELKDSYKSIAEAFIHAGAINNVKVKLNWIHSESLTDENVKETLNGLKGILVAPGFGNRGIEGKISAIEYARENNIPFFGICLGMQCAVIEFARNVLGLKDAHSREMNPATSNPVIDLLEAQKNISRMGGTMRLGAYPCRLDENTLAYKVYGAKEISERHRHRYEFNNEYLTKFKEAGMIISGINPNAGLVEIVELNRKHPFFMGVQFHPEYKSTVEKPHPLFVAFVKAAIDNK